MKVLVIWLAILFACVCNAQAQEVRIVERLADGSYAVMIDQVEHRAITGQRAVELAAQNKLLQVCRENEERYIQRHELAKRDVTIANQERDIERANFVHAMSLYEKEREMRQELSKFVPKAPPKGIAGAFIRFLDSPAGEIAFRLVVPSAQAIKVFTSK